MTYHRETLDTLAMAQLDCEGGPLEVVDTTPPDMREYMHDPQARRYTVRGCGNERSYMCFEFAMDALPQVEVHPETYEVRADGELLTCQPAEVLPMAQRYFLF